MARRRAGAGLWQSFADLAMGLMAVFALVLVMLLWTQSDQNRALASQRDGLAERMRELEAEKTALEKEKRILEAERTRFALELVQIIDSTYRVVQDQDGAEAWIRDLFAEEGCPLELTPDGTLRRRGGSGENADDLYLSGDTRLNPAATEALQKCRKSFRRLAYCLSPDGDPAKGTPRAQRCLGASRQVATEHTQLVQLREGLEALVLQGNTDRAPLGRADVPSIKASDSDRLRFGKDAESFLQNARLGAERARQALCHLLAFVEADNHDSHDAFPVWMARVRIEDARFGRYQVRPPPGRKPRRWSGST